MSEDFNQHPNYPHGTKEFPYRKIFGYARVSTEDQDMSLQVDALEKFGCDKIFMEKKSAAAVRRPEFSTMLRSMREGDMIVVWKLDRLGRSVTDLSALLQRMNKQGVELKSLTQDIDTSSAFGKAIFYFIAVLAEMERDMISERTKAGMALRKAEGVQFGKPSKVKGERKLKILLDIWALQEPLPKVAKKYGYKSHSIFQKYFPNERKKAFAARADGEDEFLIAMCMRVMDVATEQGLKPEHVREILKDRGIDCSEHE